MGQNFSWIEQVGHRSDRQRVRRQRAGDLWDEVGRICIENECICFGSRSKAKAKPRRPTSACPSTRTVPNRERIWTDVEPGTRSNLAYPVEKDWLLFFVMVITSRRRWGDLILEIERFSSERIWELSTLVWWKVEEHHGKRRRKQEKISILYWLVRTRNSLSPSSSMWFRTHSHWSFTAGQCVNSGQFLRVHLSSWMCKQFTLHDKCRIDTGRTKLRQGKTDSILYFTVVNPMDKEYKDPKKLDLTKPRLARYKQKKR